MTNAAQLLPGRLRAAATAIANARAGRGGAPDIANVLEILPSKLFAEVVEDARAALDAADAADPAVAPLANEARGADRIKLAATVGLDLGVQAVVLIDVARGGTVTSSTWAARPGTPSQAIAEWARGLHAHAITAVPFQTVFGWSRGGRPTPLTDAQRASLPEAAQAFVERNTIDPAEAHVQPLDVTDAEALRGALDAGTLLILARDRRGRASAAYSAIAAGAQVLAQDQAQDLWMALARAFPSFTGLIEAKPEPSPSPDRQEL